MESVTSQPTASERRPHRLQGAMFTSIGEQGRAELVEKRLADAITGGHLRAGERLPSEADLARTMGVAPVTVREALLGLRARGLVVTRRGRHGGSFVSESADPFAFAREALRASSGLALRDLALHYAAITVAAVRLAARRSAPSEIDTIRAKMGRLDTEDAGLWRQTMDDLQLELVALSQSARLTRDQMRLQAELSPLLRLLDGDTRARQRTLLDATLDAVADGDDVEAARLTELAVTEATRALLTLRAQNDET
ncbi:FadR/GntR family transcriptional regulator [Microbacterium sp. bgisy189]|uniref:FadR/GntR family transcriptional regulator n=1 Tax=Microbacterium sp. bgisy189 TaxID=3413798 RepID=UPI003EBE0948